jgi:diguanylate cyclase (GGDEF)-like protein
MESVIDKQMAKPKQAGSRKFFRRIDSIIRRLLDIAASGMAMIVLWPAYLAIVFLIKRDSPGPIIYKGERSGKNGNIFMIRKFRTMYENPESYKGARVTAQDDPRITPFGRFLRDTKLNELPQLWNVFVGEMSLVGPRPEDPKIVNDWPEDVRKEVLSVRPGITSPASVLYRNEEELLQTQNVMERYLWDILPSKLRLDQLYVRNRNIFSDLDVIFWTAVLLLPRMRNATIPEHLLYRGPLSILLNRYVLWFTVDFVVSLFSVGVVGGLRRLSGPLDIGYDVSIGIATLMALLFSLINSIMGINRIKWARATAGEALDLAISTGIVTLLLFIGNLMLPNGPLLPPIVVVMSGMLAFAGFVVVRYRTRLITGLASRWVRLREHGLEELGEPVIIIGAGETGRFATWLLRDGPLAQAFNLVGIVDDDPTKHGFRLDGLEVIGSSADLPNLLEVHDIGLVLFAISEIKPSESERIVDLCKSSGARVIMVPDVMDSLRAYFPKDEAEREELVGKVLQNTIHDRLTGAHNRQSFMRQLDRELPRALRYGHPCSLVALRVNFHWPDGAARSRTVTAQVLQVVAERTLKNIREIDLYGRYGENDFVIMLPETDSHAAQRVIERLHRHLTGTPVWTDRGPLNISLAIGIVTQPDEGSDAEALIEEAFKTLRPFPFTDGSLGSSLGEEHIDSVYEQKD